MSQFRGTWSFVWGG